MQQLKLPTTLIACVFFSFILFLVHTSANAHGDDARVDPKLLLDILAKSLDLQTMAEKNRAPNTRAVIGANRRAPIEAEDAFTDIVRSALRYYHQEIQEDCDHCLSESANDWEANATQTAEAQSYFRRFFAQRFRDSFYNVVIRSAQMTAEYGTAAGLYTLAFEAAEDLIIIKIATSAGIPLTHFMCSAGAAAIIFATRDMQTLARMYTYAGVTDHCAIRNFALVGLTARQVRLAQKRAALDIVGGFEIDKDALEHVDEEGPNRYWGWAKDGKRKLWVDKLQANVSPLASKLVDLEEKLETLALDSTEYKKLEKERDKIITKIRKLTQVDVREYKGGKLLRYLFILGRKHGHKHYMKGDTFADEASSKGLLLLVGMQANITDRALVQNQYKALIKDEIITTEQSISTPNASDPVIDGLIRDFVANSKTINEAEAYNLASNIAAIFDTNHAYSQRTVWANNMENMLTGFMLKTINNLVGNNKLKERGYWANLFASFFLNKTTGKYTYYTHEFADLLRIMAVESDPKKAAKLKYEAIETFFRIYTHLREFLDFPEVRTGESLNNFRLKIRQANKELNSVKIWQEKRSWQEFIPALSGWGIFPRRFPYCEDLNGKWASEEI